MYVYEVLEQILKEKNISVAEAARISNLSDSTVRGIIKRKQKNIALEVAFKISNGLGVSLERLNGMPERVLTPVGPKDSKESPSTDEAAPGDIFTSIEQQYGSDAPKALSMYVQLDSDDRGEIRGEMKQMLKADKYKTAPCSKGKTATAV